MSLPSHTALPCWALDWRLWRTNDLTLPMRMPKRMRAMPRVRVGCWGRCQHGQGKWMPQGAQLTHPQLIGAAKGIMPWGGSVTEHDGNFAGTLKNRRLSFPLFRETTKEDAISYRDWHSKIEDALEQGHDPTKVKEAMFASLEGMAKDNAKMIDENGDLHVTCILDGLDSLYGVSMMFQSLNAALCSLQQRPMESVLRLL